MKASTLISVLATLLIGSALAIKIRNPVINESAADPGAIYYEGFYYVVTTGGPADQFAIHRSKDLQNWDLVGYALAAASLPKWAIPDDAFWAPEIHIINNKFMLYFTAREVGTKALCIGVASADNITGPYTDKGSPLIINSTASFIDATVFDDNIGKKYLVWKYDQNNPKLPTWISAQELSTDGFSVQGQVTQLIKNDLSWEGELIEAPWFIKRGDWYYLFYSGHGFCDAFYAVGVARSKNPLGPYEKKGDPILHTGSGWVGPGHCSVLEDAQEKGKYIMFYHSWEQGKVCGENIRYMLVDFIQWKDDWPLMQGQTPSNIHFLEA